MYKFLFPSSHSSVFYSGKLLCPHRIIKCTRARKGDALGFTPGNVPWDQITEGHGIYYITDHTPGTGGNVTLRKNPRYWMETPPLGEIDFIRKPNGCFKIDIYDIIIAASAYSSQGSSIPDPNWFPGVDLAPPDGVDIFDIVTVTGKYGHEFDCDP